MAEVEAETAAAWGRRMQLRHLKPFLQGSLHSCPTAPGRGRCRFLCSSPRWHSQWSRCRFRWHLTATPARSSRTAVGPGLQSGASETGMGTNDCAKRAEQKSTSVTPTVQGLRWGGCGALMRWVRPDRPAAGAAATFHAGFRILFWNALQIPSEPLGGSMRLAWDLQCMPKDSKLQLASCCCSYCRGPAEEGGGGWLREVAWLLGVLLLVL